MYVYINEQHISIFWFNRPLNIGTFNTIYVREFHSAVRVASSTSSPGFSVRCCLVAVAIVSPSVIALPLQQCEYTHMHNLACRLRFWLSFGNEKSYIHTVV